MATTKLTVFLTVAVSLLGLWAFLLPTVTAGMDEFLRNSLYSIVSLKDDGAMTLVDSPQNSYKIVKTQKWNNMPTQKWIVKDFQSIGRYEFTPLIHNTSSNVVTYQLTKNVYSHKRQWKVYLISNQRYQIQNPESGYCLTNMGYGQQVDETECQETYSTNQIWKFRIIPKPT